MRENLDLGWILPGTYPFLGEDVSGHGGALVKFLNRVTGDRWSRLEMTVMAKHGSPRMVARRSLK